MALSVLLRGRGSIQALPELLACSASAIKVSPRLVQFSNINQERTLSLAQKFSQTLTKPTVRNISLSAPCKSAHGNHSVIWTVERFLAGSLIAIVPAALAFPCTALDNALAIAVVLHVHWGLEAIVVDYVRPIMVGNVIPKVALLALYLVSISMLAGLLYFNSNDIGIGKSIRKIWSIKE